jgi:hypothetical protein
VSEPRWYQSREAWRLIALGFLPWLAGLNLAWEASHVRLYALWTETKASYIAFSVLHCTLGDVLIGAAALFLALIAGREGLPAQWRWRRIVALTALAGTGYTVFSEWMNITLFRSWTYAESMPTLDLGGFELGLTPLAQWLVVPPLALSLAARRYGLSSRPPGGGAPAF